MGKTRVKGIKKKKVQVAGVPTLTKSSVDDTYEIQGNANLDARGSVGTPGFSAASDKEPADEHHTKKV